MDINTYTYAFDITWFNHDTSGLSRSDFLVLDDVYQNPGTVCGSECTRHEFTLTSHADQNVLITVNTWDLRSYPADCHEDASEG